MKSRLIWIYAVLHMLSMSLAARDAAGAYPLSRGRQVLLDRGLQIQTLVFFDQPGVENIDFDRWESANFTTMNIWEAQNPLLPSQLPAGMAWGRQYIPGLPGTPSTFLYSEELPHVPNLVSLQYADEIQSFTPAVLNDMATAFQHWKTNYPNTLAYTNFGGPTGHLSDAELSNFMNVTKPDMLSFDVYPHRYGTPLSDWYAAMQRYRQVALGGYEVSPGVNSGPLPYAQYLNTCRTSPTEALPTESFIRLQKNASWAFGYTFVSDFVYNSYNDSDVSSVMFDGMGDGTPTSVLSYVSETNRQSLNLGPALVRLLSTDVRFITGRHPNSNRFDSDGDANPLPEGLTRASAGTGWGHEFVTNVAALNIGDINQQSYLFSERSLAGDVVLGFFEVLDESFDGPDASGETYFMIVNGLTEGEGAPPGDTHQRVSIHFNFGASGITSLQRLSRDTGLVEVVPLIHDGDNAYHLELTLDGGEGDLFKFNTGAAFVPEPGLGGLLAAGAAMLMQRRAYR